jgi:type I restriction enzyme S subunit
MSWRSATLGELADFRNGLNYTKDNFGSGLRIISVKDFGDRTEPDYESLDEINPHGVLRDEALLQKGDILFVR